MKDFFEQTALLLFLGCAVAAVYVSIAYLATFLG